mmetsp:Transcript_83445/g.131417  ORF Transcript_83445/g.131417 Transcript_83445/m.131417 type:complete len:466 (+) Transcript_83445:92-1489(+)
MLLQTFQRAALPWRNAEIRPILFSYFVVSIIYTLGIQLYGPFLRTMVSCETPVAAGDFTGSAFCGDAAYVLSTAQAQEGALVSMKLVVHACAGPFLGSLADRLGRKPMLLMSIGGFALAFFLFFVAAASIQHRSFAIVAVCFFIEGATNAFNVVYMSMLADVSYVTDRASAFAAYQMTGAASQVLAQLISVSILRTRLTTYTQVWLVQCAVLVFDVLFVWYATRETLTQLHDQKEQKIKNLTLDIIKGPFELLRSERFLWIWLLSVMIMNLGNGLSGVLASFTIAVYGWRPGDYQALAWMSKCLQTGSLAMLSPLVNSRWRPATIALFSVATSIAGSFVQVFSPLSPSLLFGPGYIMDLLSFTAPADAAFLSLQFDAEKQARVNAVQHFCLNISASISIALFSSPALFKPEANMQTAMRPFVLTFVLASIGGATKAFLIRPHLRIGKTVPATPERQTSEELDHML